MARSVSVTRRFSLAYFALAALFGAAVGMFIVLVERPAPKPAPPWSAWQPTETEPGARQQQIAEHIGSAYHLAGGKRLVNVVVRDPGTTSNPIREVAVARTLEPTQRSDILAVIDSSKTAMYILCGDGPKCSIKQGKPSTARGAVLRREALELALYTFRYLDDTESVVAFFPPKKGDDLTNVLFFTRSQFSDELDTPLRKTLPEAKAPVPGRFSAVERRIVDALTVPRQFRFALRSEQDGSRVLVLAPGS
jgi:hypothetical protein